MSLGRLRADDFSIEGTPLLITWDGTDPLGTARRLAGLAGGPTLLLRGDGPADDPRVADRWLDAEYLAGLEILTSPGWAHRGPSGALLLGWGDRGPARFLLDSLEALCARCRANSPASRQPLTAVRVAVTRELIHAPVTWLDFHVRAALPRRTFRAMRTDFETRRQQRLSPLALALRYIRLTPPPKENPKCRLTA